jgi:DNA repair exonuclease SbcCD ATPase subunit/DNA repair exonuclease SbcCD nuclease subunit
MKYKFAHFADVHWRGLSRHDEYRRSFERAFDMLRKQKVDAIFIAGDIVHSKTQGISPELIDCLCWWFKGLAEIAPTYVTLGNHDGLILNKDREDAISPIIRALDLPDLHLIKMTDKVSLNEEIDIVNFSCFDEDGWEHISPTPGKINIAVFHGSVWGSKTDIDWELEGEVELSMFSGYDFVFLGDIHKQQYLDTEKRVAYCGSTIQQNFGEAPGKGYMLWDIDTAHSYDSRHIEIPHDRPFVTLDWAGSVIDTLDAAEQYDDHSRFRIKATTPISQGEIKQLYASLKEFKHASEIVMKFDVPKNDLVLESFNKTGTINLHDPKIVSSMVVKYFEKAGLSDRVNDRLDELVHRLWKSAMKSDRYLGGRWSLKNVTFDNTFGYGKDNIINFDNLNGITGIFGKNRVGKSSICGTLMYTLFNSTDRGTISNLHVVNTRKGHCKSSAVVSKAGKNYLIERQTVKKQARSGKLSAATHLNLFELDDDGSVVKDMCGEQRRETEKTLREIVGISEDFLLTSFASQGEMNSFLKQRASARKSILSKFLELDVFDRLHEAAREESAGVKQLLKSMPARDFDITLIDLKNKLRAREADRDTLWEELEVLRSKISELELTLATRGDNNLVTQQDIEEQKAKLQGLKKEKQQRDVAVTALGDEVDDLGEKVEKLQAFKNEFPVEELKVTLEEQNTLENSASLIKHSVEKEKQRLNTLKKQVNKLADVPCGDSFPTCKYIISATKAKKQLTKQSSVIEDLREDLKLTRRSLKKLLDKQLVEKLDKYNDLIAKFNQLTVDKGKKELLLTTEKTHRKNITHELTRAEQSLDEMRANLSTDDAAKQVRALRDKLRRLKISANDRESKHAALSEAIGLYHSNIEKIIEEKEKFESLNEKWRVFELFLQATSKNGVPLEVIRSRLPEINTEIASVLQGVTGFTVELESDEGSNEMAIYINYGDSKRIIECCSGMEKMMAALAIRVALINVSTLPKSDVLIIDEGFGALDSGNIEACGRFLEALKKWFKTILVISHVDAVKDGVDNVLEISRNGPDAKVQAP